MKEPKPRAVMAAPPVCWAAEPNKMQVIIPREAKKKGTWWVAQQEQERCAVYLVGLRPKSARVDFVSQFLVYLAN